jgi:hypothetical protein
MASRARDRGFGRRAALVSLAALALGCSSSLDPRVLEIDCSENDRYEFNVLQPMEGTTVPWFGFGDMTPGATQSIAFQPIPEGRCGSASALVINAHGYDDWGAGFGEYQTAMAPADASAYEGVSFWARAGDGASTGFQMTLSDRNTDPMGMVCIEPETNDVLAGAYTYNEAGMVVPVGGELPSPQDCGNVFVRVVSVTREWHLYALPFESFQQEAQPNRNPAGLDRSALYQFSINITKDSAVELWLDDLGLYRHVPAGLSPAASNAD